MPDLPIPPVSNEDYEDQILGFVREALEEGDAFLQSQRGFSKIDDTIKVIMSDDLPLSRTSSISQTRTNRTAKIGEDLAALLTDIKPFWDYKSENPLYDKQVTNFGKLSLHWYLQRGIDVRMNDVVKYWEVAGTGWGHLYWDDDLMDQNLAGEDPRDVIPIRPSSYHTIQDAMGVIIRRERTVNYLRQQYPEKAGRIVADRDGSAVTNLANTRAGQLLSKFGTPFRRALYGGGKQPAREIPRIPTVDEYTVYLDDRRVNKSGHPVGIGQFSESGEPLNNWSYIVMPGEQLYPRKRCIVCTRTAVLYDSTSIYWHGMYPLFKFTLNPWPWSWLGKAPLWDLLPLQRSLDRALRAVDDYIDKAVQPDIVADKANVSKQTMDMLNSRRAGLKIRQNAMAGKGLQYVYPNPLPPTVENQIKFLIDEMRELSGVVDMTQLMRLNQMPSSETVEKIIEGMSPAVRGRSRFFEAFMREFATVFAFNCAQFYTLPMRLLILGPSGITQEDVDFDPGSIIPDFVHSSDYDEKGLLRAEAIARGPLPRHERAKEFMRQFTFHVMPGSLLAASAIEQKLLYLQLARAGWVDLWTLLEKLEVTNVGMPPAGADTIMDRLMAQQQMGLGMQVSAAGRKASGEQMPQMKISESG